MTNVIAQQQYFHQTVVPAAVAQSHIADDVWMDTYQQRAQQAPARYVVGYCFNSLMTQVVLIEKQKPAWQAGKFNGVGGKCEHSETPVEAMEREFQEEANANIYGWLHFHTERFPSEAEHVRGQLQGAVIYHLAATASPKEWEEIHTMEAERIVKVSYPLRSPTIDRIIYNLAYLVPMAATLLALPEENRPAVV